MRCGFNFLGLFTCVHIDLSSICSNSPGKFQRAVQKGEEASDACDAPPPSATTRGGREGRNRTRGKKKYVQRTKKDLRFPTCFLDTGAVKLHCRQRNKNDSKCPTVSSSQPVATIYCGNTLYAYYKSMITLLNSQDSGSDLPFHGFLPAFC
jgi:hypothetical protein